jgi:hypothetical protein
MAWTLNQCYIHNNLACISVPLMPAESRPLNSALGMDLDFERTLAPPPQPTEEATASLEDVIRQRIADARWDDVPRAAPPPPEKRRAVLELDDNKSGKVRGVGSCADGLKRSAPLSAALRRAVIGHLPKMHRDVEICLLLCALLLL